MNGARTVPSSPVSTWRRSLQPCPQPPATLAFYSRDAEQAPALAFIGPCLSVYLCVCVCHTPACIETAARSSCFFAYRFSSTYTLCFREIGYLQK